MADEVRYASM